LISDFANWAIEMAGWQNHPPDLDRVAIAARIPTPENPDWNLRAVL
jgi:hypothetical protein